MTRARKAAPVGRRRTGWWIAATVAVLVLVPFCWFVKAHWPYRYRNVKPLLENVFASQITITKYSRTYFPHPGFVADGITLRRKSTDANLPALGQADHLEVQGGWLDLLMLREHIELVEVKGMHVVLPAAGSDARKKDFPAGSSADFAGPSTSIGKLVLRDAILEIQRTGDTPLRFPLKELVVHDVKKGANVRYELDMTNAMPTGHILAHGNFGPLLPNNLGDTPLSGDFTFDQGQLKEIGLLRGVLSLSGHFDKTLSSIQCQAKSDTPAFAIGEGRAIHVTSDVKCTINGLNGDVILNDVALRMGATPVRARGTIVGDPKVTKLEVDVDHGLVQDILRPFDSKTPPISGAVMLHMRAQILPAPKGAKFLDRLKMQGAFAVPNETITNKDEEQKLSAFSARAQGEKEDESHVDALSSLSGNATVSNGIVTAQALQFAVAGASADFHGTYSLTTKKVDMAGTLRMDKDLSHVATGFKSLLLKPIAPFFEHKHAGTVVPIAVTGQPGSYSVSQNLLHNK